MIYKRCTNPEVFGFGVFIPKKYYYYILKYKKRALPYINWFVKKDYKYPSNLMRAHITLKYLGYHSKYTNREIEKLIPDLVKISKKYFPIKIKVKVLIIGTKYQDAGVLLNFEPKNKLKKFHNEIVKKLGNKIDIFENMDLKNFEPHIALGSGSKTKENLKNLKKIERESKKDRQVEIILNEAYIFFKNKGPVRIY